MGYIKVSVYTTPEGMELVAASLMELGLEMFEWVQGRDEVQAFLDETAAYWDYVDAAELGRTDTPCLRLTLADDAVGQQQLMDIQKEMARLKQGDWGVDVGELEVVAEPMDDSDWQNAWKAYYKPILIGDKLCICPAWEDVPPQAEGRTVVRINPGMAFGTGQHESTALCLKLLEGIVTLGMRMLDAGCGSGILSMAALMLGADSAVGVDIDVNTPAAVEENCRLAGIAPGRMETIVGNILEDQALIERLGGGYDLMAANIVADVILRLIPLVPGFLRPGAPFITSGIVVERLPEVEAALAQHGLTVVNRVTENGWVALHAVAQSGGK
nr:50S ribosomal protein L11 methyltransferase [bacterium]